MEKMVLSPKGRIQSLIDRFGPCHPLVITMLETYGSDGGEFVLAEEPVETLVSHDASPQEK